MQTNKHISRFSSLLDIDKLILCPFMPSFGMCFSSLLDIDKLIPAAEWVEESGGFSSLLDIDKLILRYVVVFENFVLVFCWILINLL